jgi:hypothetical protein
MTVLVTLSWRNIRSGKRTGNDHEFGFAIFRALRPSLFQVGQHTLQVVFIEAA